jgi:hypothetical protein
VRFAVLSVQSSVLCKRESERESWLHLISTFPRQKFCAMEYIEAFGLDLLLVIVLITIRNTQLTCDDTNEIDIS